MRKYPLRSRIIRYDHTVCKAAVCMYVHTPYLWIRRVTVHAQLLADPPPLHHGDGRLRAEEHQVGHDTGEGDKEWRRSYRRVVVAVALAGRGRGGGGG